MSRRSFAVFFLAVLVIGLNVLRVSNQTSVPTVVKSPQAVTTPIDLL